MPADGIVRNGKKPPIRTIYTPHTPFVAQAPNPFIGAGRLIPGLSAFSALKTPGIYVFTTAKKARKGKTISGKQVRDVILKYPTCAVAYFSRGIDWDKKGEFKKAIDDYSLAIINDPRHFKAYNNRGSIYGALGEFDREFKDYLSAIRIQPSYAKRYVNLYIKRIKQYKNFTRPQQVNEHCRHLLALEPTISKLNKFNDYCM